MHGMQAGMGVTLHIGEVSNDVEVALMLDLCPDRLGHMCFASETNMQRLLVRDPSVGAKHSMAACTFTIPGYECGDTATAA